MSCPGLLHMKVQPNLPTPLGNCTERSQKKNKGNSWYNVKYLSNVRKKIILQLTSKNVPDPL